MGRNTMKKAGWVIAAMSIACAAASSLAVDDISSQDLFYTRWFTTTPMEANIRKTVATYNRTTGTFSCTVGTDVAHTNGCDGLAFAPDLTGDLLVGGQGVAFYRVNPTTAAITSTPLVAGADAFEHIVVDPSLTKAWTTNYISGISEVPLTPTLGPAVFHTISGSVRFISSLVFVNGTVFYVSSDENGVGSFGTINMTTFVTTQLIPAGGGTMPGMHDIAYDPFSQHLLMAGADQFHQVDPLNPSVILSSVTIPAASFLCTGAYCGAGGFNYKHIDRVVPDGNGLLYLTGNDGTLFLLDYKGAPGKLIAGGILKNWYLDTYLDDIVTILPPPQLCCEIGTGDYDRHDSQVSQIPFPTCGDSFAFQAADDFYLCPGRIYNVTSITATFATDQTLFPKAGVQIFEDCDGHPGAEIIFSSSNPDDRPVVNVFPTGVPYNSTLDLVTIQATFPALWLRGGKSYWVSFYGRGCGGTTWAWTTAGNGTIQGRTAMFRSYQGGNTFSPWAPLDECCIGCTDLSFCVAADDCKILLDNGTFVANGAPSVEYQTQPSFTSKAAADFVIPPCASKEICYIEAYILSNCPQARLDLYESECNLPSSNNPFRTLIPKRIVHLNPPQFIQYQGQQLEVLCLQFWGDGVILQGGRNYWLSAFGYDTGNAIHKALFAYNKNCANSCLIHFNQGAVRGAAYNSPNWEQISDSYVGVPKDFAFMIAIMDPNPSDAGAASPVCNADIDRNGLVTIDDIFVYLNLWFAGCP